MNSTLLTLAAGAPAPLLVSWNDLLSTHGGIIAGLGNLPIQTFATPIASIIVALATSLVVIRLKVWDRAQERRTVSLRLHETYLSPEFYQKVRGPVTVLRRVWVNISDDQRSAFRSLVASGWDEDWQNQHIVTGSTREMSDWEQVTRGHFYDNAGSPSLTEHQALTVLIKFWTRVHLYIEEKLVNRKLTKRLLSDEWSYVATFLTQLSYEVQARKKSKGKRKPQWIESIDYLNRLFGTAPTKT